MALGLGSGWLQVVVSRLTASSSSKHSIPLGLGASFFEEAGHGHCLAPGYANAIASAQITLVISLGHCLASGIDHVQRRWRCWRWLGLSVVV